MTEAATDLPNTMISKRREQRQRLLQQDRRVEQHADGDEEQHRKRVAQRQRLLAPRCWLSSDSLRIMPAKNAPSANETPNSMRRAEGDAERERSTARRNSSRDPVWAT